uniref:Uncharacterized protein n=1 Tax=Anopheles epiroticus TaxID=199890 RepID=A0A182PHK7_9DIPT
MSKHCCNNPKNLFCFVCGLYTLSHHKRSIMTLPLLSAYEAYFKVRTSKENYKEGPPSVCNVCNNALLRWQNGMCQKPDLPFAIPMLWSAPTDHATDCYFCLTKTPSAAKSKLPAKYNMEIVYPSVKSAVRPKIYSKTMQAHPIEYSINVLATPTTQAVQGKQISSDGNKKTNSLRQYPTGEDDKLAAKEPITVKMMQSQPTTRRSLPAQGTAPVGMQLKVVPVSTIKRKADTAAAYDNVTKVWLRKSEPTDMLKKKAKLVSAIVPANATLVQHSMPVTSPTASPKILNVFSLNKNAVNSAESKRLIFTDEQQMQPSLSKATDMIETDKKEGKTVAPETKEPVEQHQASKAVVSVKIKQEKEEIDTAQQPPPISAVPEHIPDLKAVKVERQSPPPLAELQMAPPPNNAPAMPGFINIYDLPMSSSANGVMVVKVPAAIEPTQPTGTALKTSPKPVMKPSESAATALTGQDDAPHRITQSELILLLRELELRKEKSAILIDRLKRWNLLAVELVGQNRTRPLDPAAAPHTAVHLPQKTTVVALPPSSTSSPSSSSTVPVTTKTVPLATVTTSASAPAAGRIPLGPYTGTVTSLAKIKDLQVRSTRAGQQTPIIITSSTNITATTQTGRLNAASKQPEGGLTKPSIPRVITTSVTTRSARNALAKQNVTAAQIK